MLRLAFFSAVVAVALANVPANPDDEYIKSAVVRSKLSISDTMTLHDVKNKPFDYVLIFKQTGKADLWDGSVSNIHSYEYVRVNRLSSNLFEIQLFFDKVTFNYKYRASFPLMLGNSGVIDGTITDMSFDITCKIENGEFVQVGVPAFHMGDVDVFFSKGSLLDIVYNALRSTFISAVKQFTAEEFANPIGMEIVKHINIAASQM